MSRLLGWFGLGVLIIGIVAAVVMRLAMAETVPETVLQFGFQADPANAVVVAAVAVGAVCLSLSAYGRWQNSRFKRQLAAQADSLETERRRFIQRLDHELKNPLTAIQVQLDNLQAGEVSPATIAEVRTQTDRLSTLTRGLRRLADLETRALESERIQVGELLGEVIDLLQAPERIALDVQKVPWPIPPIEGDRELLLMAFRNLVDNALKYSPADTAVQVRARHTSGALVVEVIDTGRGIQPDELPLVVEELYRGSNTRDVAGSGLGLAMAQRIIERHNGRLEIRSRPAQGTIATVQLPYEQTR
jgi:signal transduction histidine kinase